MLQAAQEEYPFSLTHTGKTALFEQPPARDGIKTQATQRKSALHESPSDVCSAKPRAKA